MSKPMIVTFSCGNLVHVYEPKCGLIPRNPYMVHENVESAIRHLKYCGKENIKVKINKTTAYGR